MAEYAIKQVDAFTTEPLRGNPCGVVADVRGLDVPTMQRIAREMNLSEATFVFPSTQKGIEIGREGRVAVRVLEADGIFTPQVGGQAVTVIEAS